MQPAEINQDKKFVYMHLCTLLQWHIHQSCNLFTITIENLLHFLEYFDDKANSMKDFPLGFVKVRSTHLSFGFLNKCGKIWKRKDRANILRSAILNLVHVASKSSSRTPRSKKCYRRCTNGRVRSCSSKTAEENEENIEKLDISLNRQNIIWFAATPVTDFCAGRARFDISAEFFLKIVFRQEWHWNVFFFWKQASKIGVRIIHGCALYTGKYDNVKIWNWVLLFGKASWNPCGCLKVNSWIRNC